MGCYRMEGITPHAKILITQNLSGIIQMQVEHLKEYLTNIPKYDN